MKWNVVLACLAGLIIAGLVAFAWLHGANLSVLNPAGPVGSEERDVIVITVLLSAVVVLPLFGMLFAFAWKYRSTDFSAQVFHEPNWDHDSWMAEAVWWVVPTIIVFTLSVLLIKTSHDLDPYRPLASSVEPITIEVVALDWKWLFIYPEQGIATVNMIEFPVGTPVHFELTADAPMNQFWIPKLGGQIMVMPGMQTQLSLLSNSTGEFNGLSSEINGEGFAGMNFTAKAVSIADFNSWVMNIRASNRPLTANTYSTLAASSTYNPVSYYSSVDPDLYNTVMMNYMMPHTAQSMGSMPMSGMDMSQ
jgi:cytochrome o ubiquinol oxidase subunit II